MVDLYCGINLKWNYEKKYVNLSMPKYIMKQLTWYAHVTPLKSQHCPFSRNPINYGKNNQAPNPTDDSPLLNNARKKQIQQVVGTLPKGYIRNVPLPRVPILQSTSSETTVEDRA
jgi:hypothetical protein